MEITLLQEVNPDGQPKTKAELVANVRKAFQGAPVERFFKNNPKFIEELADKVASLADDLNTPICNKDLLPKTAQFTMHQQVIYYGEFYHDKGQVLTQVLVADYVDADDSTSMKREGRWNPRTSSSIELPESLPAFSPMAKVFTCAISTSRFPSRIVSNLKNCSMLSGR
jgi:hypothetical protein